MRWLVVIAVGCSSSSAVMPDAAITNDAGVDAADASPCVLDGDGDGVCDAFDVCPSVFDPGQVDLDQDGVGWVCDPVESTTLQLTPPFQLTTSYAEQTFAASLRFGCTTTACQHAVIAMSPDGKSLARSDSGLAADAWTSISPKPYVLPGNTLLWSRNVDDTGRLDLSTGTFTVIANQYVTDTGGSGAIQLLALRQPSSLAADLVRPSNGQLLPVTSAPGGFAFDSYYGRALLTTPTPGRIVVPVRSGTTYSLHTFDTATNALQQVMIDGAPAVALDELYMLPNNTGSGAIVDMSPWCARKGSTTYLVAIRHDTTSTHALPFASCFAVSTATNIASVAAPVLPIVGWTASNTLAFALERNGQVATFDTAQTDSGYVRVFGTSLPVVAFTTSTTSTTRVWALTPGGTFVEVPHNLRNAVVSVHGETVHVAGVQGTSGFAPLVLVRYRVATGVQSVTVKASVSTFTTPQLVTTAEGAAIVSDGSTAFAVPSGSMTASMLDIDDAAGGPRGSATVLYGTDWHFAGAKPKVYAYDEVNGAARLTALTPEILDASPGFRLVDPHHGMSPWFAFDYAGFCRFGRIIYVNGAPALDQPANCEGTHDMRTVGSRSNGDHILINVYSVFVLGSTTVTRVATSTHNPDVLYDYGFPTTIVGWRGTDAHGPFACLASHPERCWTHPAMQQGTAQTLAVSAADDMFALMSFAFSGTTGTISVVRPLGTGNRSQPL